MSKRDHVQELLVPLSIDALILNLEEILEVWSLLEISGTNVHEEQMP